MQKTDLIKKHSYTAFSFILVLLNKAKVKKTENLKISYNILTINP